MSNKIHVVLQQTDKGLDADSDGIIVCEFNVQPKYLTDIRLLAQHLEDGFKLKFYLPAERLEDSMQYCPECNKNTTHRIDRSDGIQHKLCFECYHHHKEPALVS